jgi:hypothetical protein
MNVDYYMLLDVPDNASAKSIATTIRKLLKKWHPDVNHSSDAHEMTVALLEAKRILLNPALRIQYDRLRQPPFSQPATPDMTAARKAASAEASQPLNELLAALSEAVAEMAHHTWVGDDEFFDTAETTPFGQWRWIWTGVAGWAFVICLIVPGSSLLTLWVFGFALFPPPSRDFVGLQAVLHGMLKTAALGGAIVAGSACLGLTLAPFLIANEASNPPHTTTRGNLNLSPNTSPPVPRPRPRPRRPTDEGWSTATTTGNITWQRTESHCFAGTESCALRCVRAWNLRTGPQPLEDVRPRIAWMNSLTTAAESCYTNQDWLLGTTDFIIRAGGASLVSHTSAQDPDGDFGRCLVRLANNLATTSENGQNFRFTYDCPRLQ